MAVLEGAGTSKKNDVFNFGVMVGLGGAVWGRYKQREPCFSVKYYLST